jgi:hypothetical protein
MSHQIYGEKWVWSFLKGCPGWLGSEPGIFWFNLFSLSITLPLSHSVSPTEAWLLKIRGIVFFPLKKVTKTWPWALHILIGLALVFFYGPPRVPRCRRSLGELRPSDRDANVELNYIFYHILAIKYINMYFNM